MEVQSLIPYKGEVRISFLDAFGKAHEVFRHNEALPELSRIFARFMIGEDMLSYVPTYLDIVHMDINSGSYKSDLNIRSILTGKYTSSDNSEDEFYYASFTGIITYDQYSPSAADTRYLVLANKYEPLARIEFSSELQSYLTNGSNLVINWRIRIINPGV